MVSVIQIAGFLFGLIMIYLSYMYFKRKDFNRGDLIVWLIIWVGLIVAISLPETLQFLLQPLSIYRVMDLMVVTAFGVAFMLLFVIYHITRKTQKDVENIVRKLALKGNG